MKSAIFKQPLGSPARTSDIYPVEKPKVIFFSGLPGSGKTYLAKKLAMAIGVPHISSDIVRKEMDLQQKYQTSDKHAVYKEMKRRMLAFLEKGSNVILDATYYQQELRGSFVEAAARLTDQIYWILAVCNEETTKLRVSKKRKDSEADFQVYLKIRDAFEPLEREFLSVPTDTEDEEESLRKIIAFCKL